MIGSILRSVVISAILAVVAIFLHNSISPYGLFIAIAIAPLGIRFIVADSHSKIEPVAAAITWFLLIYLASTNRNGNEILVQGDTNGNAFVIGTGSLIALALIALLGKRGSSR